jgi:hypothetical protein
MNQRNKALEGPIGMTVKMTQLDNYAGYVPDPHPPADSVPVNGGKKPVFRKVIQEVGDGLVTLLLAKNLDYGNNIAKPPVLVPKIDPQTAALVRMSDKVARLEQLTARGPSVASETLDDTLLDLAGYCILLVAHRRCSE